MFDFDAGKLVIIGIVALIVIGPKELPRVMRQVGQAVAKLRRVGAEFQAQFMEAIREADAEEMRAGARKLMESAKVDLGPNPLALTKTELTSGLGQRAPEAAPSAALPLDHAEPPAASPASSATPRA